MRLPKIKCKHENHRYQSVASQQVRGILFYQIFFLLFLKVIFLVPERRKAAAGARKRSAEAWRWDARSSPHNTAGQSSCVKVIVTFVNNL